ncbi:hypothetical protein N7471_002654 [Penicillium samsonianum]|uniref:uncharacterized protein n=1 Tax=Penicillium samsonianum TaxID=1882272 RepID=UPI00254981A1|nr:uncharacterized protein N7471_002654 [Penicillium samsonianum]KAJ6143201.1 hypothetical protein N7471_002654 [Penicillium samsonianum]
MARVIMDFKVNMSTKFEGPVWASLGIDMDTDHVERRAVLHLIREIYNPMLHDSLSKGNNWNSTFKGKKGFDIRRKLTARQNELPAIVRAHVPDPAELTEQAIAKNSGAALTNTSAPLSTPSLSLGPIPSPGPLIQPSIGPNPDLPPVVAPEALHAPIPDEPQEGYYKADDMEAPSPPRIDLDAFTRTIERANRKRARDDDEDTHPPTPPKKRSNASRSPKENTEWTKFTTLSDSSSNEEQSLDADGDTLMDRKAKPYKVKNKSDEPDNSVWSTMRDYLGRMGREPTPQEQDEEL